MSNYSTLQQNTLDGLNETAGILYLKLCDVFQAGRGADCERKAFLAACDYEENCGATLDFILRNAPFGFAVTDQLRTKLSLFFSGRWRHMDRNMSSGGGL